MNSMHPLLHATELTHDTNMDPEIYDICDQEGLEENNTVQIFIKTLLVNQ